MRVLHVIGAMDRGGAETVVMNLYRAVDREAVQFDFLVHEERECDYDAEIRSLGGRIYRLPRYNGLNGREYRALCREHFLNHPEHVVVHGHIGSCAGIYLQEAKRAGRATVLHSHAQDYGSFLHRQLFRALVRPSLKVADYFLACSPEAGRDRFGRAIVEGSRYTVMPNGIDVGLYACDAAAHELEKDALGLSGATVLCHVGRFVDVKNHRFLLKAFAAFRERCPGAKLLLLGRGPLEEEVGDQASSLGVRDDVVFCGVRDDVFRYLKASDLFVFPSVREGLAIAAVEAQAAGVPCLLSTGVPEAAAVSGFARRMDLSSGEDAWAQAAVEQLALGIPRESGAADVRRAGFDVHETAEWLSGLYASLSSR